MHRFRTDQRADGFSLLELFLSIMLVAVLLAIAIPAVTTAKAASQNARCVSNLKGLGVALRAYSADHRQTLMSHYTESVGDEVVPEDSITWVQRLMNHGYVGDPNLLVCPSHPPRKVSAAGQGNYFNFRRCYGMRVWRLPGQSFELTRKLSKPFSAIVEPSRFFLVGDSFWKNHGEQGYLVQPDPLDKNQFFHFRHRSRANFCFADGSVRGLTREEITTLALEQSDYNSGSRKFLCWPEEK